MLPRYNVEEELLSGLPGMPDVCLGLHILMISDHHLLFGVHGDLGEAFWEMSLLGACHIGPATGIKALVHLQQFGHVRSKAEDMTTMSSKACSSHGQ